MNQLTYDLAAAQNQLRSLGMKDQILYGVSVVRNQATIMWSQWKIRRIEIGPVATFDLMKPSEGVMFCQLFASLKSDIIKRSNAVNNMKEQDIANLVGKDTWKAEALPPRDQPLAKRQNTGGGDFSGPPAFQGAGFEADVDADSESNELDEADETRGGSTVWWRGGHA